MKTVLRLLLAGLLAATTWAGSIRVGRELVYPTEFDADVQTISGGDGSDSQVVVVTPGGWKRRELGAKMVTEDTVGVTLHRIVYQGRETVKLEFDDGTQATVTTGSDTVVKGDRYRGMGWKGEKYVLFNLRTREKNLFRPLTPEEKEKRSR